MVTGREADTACCGFSQVSKHHDNARAAIRTIRGGTSPNLEGCIAAERAPERLEKAAGELARGASEYTPS
jgi:hypothetical protein